MQRVIWSTLTETDRQVCLQRPTAANAESLTTQCQRIIESVKTQGDVALIEFAQRFDNIELQSLTVTLSNIDIPVKQQQAINLAYRQIKQYHQYHIPEARTLQYDGLKLRREYRPISRVGLYIPGGTAPLVSTLLMLAIPAQLAGCPVRVLCTPPSETLNPYLHYAALKCGIERVCFAGGAQAIAAMAYGTDSIAKVDKIFGPGNSWVTMAKQLVANDPAGASIDMPAGPSEILVIADDSANPDFIAADLLSQAEHGLDSQVILVTTSQAIADRVDVAINTQLASLQRQHYIQRTLAASRCIIVDDIDCAISISNRYAPEHCSLQTRDAARLVNDITSAGAVFVGDWTPETLGDYVTGSNHVLPTAGYARACSGLQVTDFMTSVSIQQASVEGLIALSDAAITLAELEGLDAHANAVRQRCAVLEKPS